MMKDGIAAMVQTSTYTMLARDLKLSWVASLRWKAWRICRGTSLEPGITFLLTSFRVTRIPKVRILSRGIEEIKNAPGGGHIITVEDPQGFPVSFMHGQSQSTIPLKTVERLVLNDETHKPRERKFQRFEPGPAEVYKLGHFGMVVSDFDVEMDWYTRYFNIIPSDILYIATPSSSTDGQTSRREVAMFAHIDRGHDLVDHHTLFLTSASPGMKHHVHHCSFEIHDFDTQALGHQWLAEKGYKSVWGIGRHILGSQIFDYWWDVSGNMIEHYADGDLVNFETPMAFGPAGHAGLAAWGPEVPKAFLE